MVRVEPPPVVTPDGLRVAFVEEPDVLEEAYRLRHRVFAEELGKTVFARDGRYADAIDRGVTHVLGAFDGATMVGTLRVTLRREQAFLDEDEALLREYMARVGADDPGRFALADRGVIAPSHRARRLYDVLWDRLFALCARAGVETVLGVVDATDEPLTAFHRRRGWITWRTGIPLCDVTGDAIAIAVSDTPAGRLRSTP